MKIFFNPHSQRGIAHLGPVGIDQAEYDRLKTDFLLSQTEGNPKGGLYKCKVRQEIIDLLLRFDEVVCIVNSDSVPQEP